MMMSNGFKCLLLSVQSSELLPVVTLFFDGAKRSMFHHSHYAKYPMIDLRVQLANADAKNQNIYGKLSIFVFHDDSRSELSLDATARWPRHR
jgi:hypothetical protein